MRIFVGASLDRLPGPKYKEALDFVELAFAGPLPKIGKLTSWRQQFTGLDVGLVVPSADYINGGVAFDRIEDCFQWTEAAVEIIGDVRTVLTPGRAFGTSTKDRARFLKGIAATPGTPVWHPGGMWDWQTAYRWANESNLLLARDPFVSETESGGRTIYLRPQAVGLTRRFSEGMFYGLLEQIAEFDADEVRIAISSDRSFDEARKLRGMISDMM